MKNGEKWLRRQSDHFKGSVYDLGCGERTYESFILRTADRYVGVDWSSTLHRLKADIVASLTAPLPIENEVADTVISFSVMEHLREPEIMLQSAFRILKQGGVIVLQVPFQWWVHEAPHDYFRFTPYGLRHLFEKTGFTDITVEPNAGFFTTLAMKLNYFSARFVRGPRLLRWVIRAGLLIPWTLSQVLAPLLDHLDRNWELEAPGYWVVARKP